MPIIYEEFIRCEHCGGADFKKVEVLTFHKLVKARVSKQHELQPLETEIQYRCVKCDAELNK